MIILGIFLSYLVAMATFMAIPSLAYSIDWRIILGLAIIPAIIALVIRVKMPESPRWLILHRKFDVATKTLKKFEVESNASDLDYTYKLLETEQKKAQKT
jgi:Sugar (and other) transporter.